MTNVESYSLPVLWSLKEVYTEFLEKTEGYDPDFPMSSFDSPGQKIGGTNIHTLERKPEFLSSEEEPNFIRPVKKDSRSTSVNERALKFLKDNGL